MTLETFQPGSEMQVAPVLDTSHTIFEIPVSSFPQEMTVQLEALSPKEELLFSFWDRELKGIREVGDHNLVELMDEHTLIRLNHEKKAVKQGIPSPSNGLAFSPKMENLDLGRFDLFRQGILKIAPKVVSAEEPRVRES